MTRLRAMVAVALAFSLPGCAIGQTGTNVRALPAEFELGRLSERTAFENGDDDALISMDDESKKDADDQNFADGDDAVDPDRAQRRRSGLFVAGLVLAGIGTGGTIAFAAGGQATQNKLGDGYETSLGRNEERDLQNRGKTMNQLAVGTAAVGVVGLTLAMIALGVDYTRCGKIVKKRHKKCSGKK